MLTMKIIAPLLLLVVVGIVLGTLKISGSLTWPWWMVLIPLCPAVVWGALVLFMMWAFKDGM